MLSNCMEPVIGYVHCRAAIKWHRLGFERAGYPVRCDLGKDCACIAKMPACHSCMLDTIDIEF